MAIEVLGVEHIDLTVNDVARSRAFYDKVLGELGFRKFEGDGLHPLGERADDDCDSRGVGRQSRRAVRSLSRRSASPRVASAIARRRRRVPRFLCAREDQVLDAPAEYPHYGENYYAVFFADPDGMKLELVHYPWGYWRKVQTEGHDARPRYESRSRSDVAAQAARVEVHSATRYPRIQSLVRTAILRRSARYWITTSSGKRNVVAPSSNCTRYMRRSRLFTSRRMRGCSLNRLRPFVVAHRFLQLAMLSDQFFCVYARHHILTPPLPFRSLPGHHHPDHHSSKLRA